MNMRHIVIVDDNHAFRASAQWWLSGLGYAVSDFGDAEAALQSLQATPPRPPACVLLDVRMPGLSGLDLHDRLNECGVTLPVIYMTGHGDVSLAVQAMQRGAVTFLEKPLCGDALEQALTMAFECAGTSVVAGTAAWVAPPRPPTAAPVDAAASEWATRLNRLTPRERELFGWVIADKLNKTISDLMGISIKTVELHRANLMRKLGAASITHLVKMAVSERVV